MRQREHFAPPAHLGDPLDQQPEMALVVDEWGTWYDPAPGSNPGFLVQQNTMRDAEVAALFPPERPDPQRKLALHLAIRLDSLARAESPASQSIAELEAPSLPLVYSGVGAADKVFLQDPANDPSMWLKLRAIAKSDADHAKNLPATPEQQRALTEFLVDAADHPDKYATMSASSCAVNAAVLRPSAAPAPGAGLAEMGCMVCSRRAVDDRSSTTAVCSAQQLACLTEINIDQIPRDLIGDFDDYI